MMALPDGALVELIDSQVPEDNKTCPMKPTHVKVNGVDVGLLQDVSVDPGKPGTDACTTVTLKILVDRLVIRKAADGEYPKEKS